MSPASDGIRGLDGTAVAQVSRRLARRGEAPWLHTEVARRMGERLDLIRLRPDRLIDWWSTLGAGAELLTAAYPKARQTRVEPDAAWLAQARRRASPPWWRAAHWTGAAVEVVLDDATIAADAGLVWANMMLHAVVDPVALIARWHALLRTDGFVMFSCLGPGTLRELRTLYAAQGWPDPTPAFVDMHDLGDMLVQAGFADPVMDQETLTLRWSSARALLDELRGLGGNAAPGRYTGLRTPRWRARLETALEGLAGTDGSIALSFEVAYGHAFKAAPRARPDVPTTVSLDEMRRMVRAPGRPPPVR